MVSQRTFDDQLVCLSDHILFGLTSKSDQKLLHNLPRLYCVTKWKEIMSLWNLIKNIFHIVNRYHQQNFLPMTFSKLQWQC